MEIFDHLLPDELKHKLSKKMENMLNWPGFPFRKTKDARQDILAYYISAVKLLQTLKRDYDLKSLEYRIKKYSRLRIMILDEIGYLPLTREESNLFFQLV